MRKDLLEKRMVCKVSIIGHREDQWAIIWLGKAAPCLNWGVAMVLAQKLADEDLKVLHATPDWMSPRELFSMEAANA
jgi:hypothetical protein